MNILVTVRSGVLATILLLCQLLQKVQTCDRDRFQGETRIDRIKEADIVVYGEIGKVYTALASGDQLDVTFDFRVYCVVNNKYQDADLDELFENYDVVLRDIYMFRDCVQEWHLIKDNKFKLAVVTLTYDSRENELLLDQINDETAIHLMEQNNYLIEEIDTLARETEDEERERDRYTSLNSPACAAVDVTAIPTTVGPASGKGASHRALGSHFYIVCLFLQFVITVVLSYDQL